jgi:phosphoketolase
VNSEHPEHVQQLESWMKSYKAEELFDENGKLIPELAELAPKGDRRMGANPHANGGLLLRDLRMPTFMNTQSMCLHPALLTVKIRSCWVISCATWPN